MHHIGLVTHGDYMHAWLLDLPGCIAGGPDLAAVERKLPLAIAEHTAWLRSHGETVAESTGWQIVETVDGATAAGGDPCFVAESEPVSDADLDTLIARLAFALDDLAATIAPLPDAILDWAPPAIAFEKFDPWAPDVRTIRGLIQHILQFEVYYRDGLRDGAAKGIYDHVTDATVEHALTVEAMRTLTADDRARVFRPLRPGQTAPEEWTLRKVARRTISHARAHTAEIQQRRTWLLLGVPGDDG